MRLLVYIRLFICMFVGTIPAYSFENTTLPDSVIQELEKIAIDTSKIRFLLNLELQYRKNGNYKLASQVIDTALSLSNNIGNVEYKGLCVFRLGTLHNNTDDLDLAKQNLKKALSYFIVSRNKRYIAMTYNSLAIIEKKQSNYKDAIILFNQSVETLTELKSREINIPLTNLGIVYKRLGNYMLSLSYYRQSLMYSDSIPDPYVYGNMGILYHHLNSLENSDKYLKMAIDVPEVKENLRFRLTAYNALIDLYLNNELYDSATKYLNLAEIINKKNKYRLLLLPNSNA